MTNHNEDSFQITLPSNSCSKFYPRIRLNSYKTKLCKELDLPTGEWEMALVDKQYPLHWRNLMESTDLAFIDEADPSLRSKDNNFAPIGINIDMSMFDGALIGGTSYDPYFGWNYKRQTCIPSGHYRSIQEVGKMIEKLFRDLMQPELEEVTGKRFAIEYSFDRSKGCLSLHLSVLAVFIFLLLIYTYDYICFSWKSFAPKQWHRLSIPHFVSTPPPKFTTFCSRASLINVRLL